MKKFILAAIIFAALIQPSQAEEKKELTQFSLISSLLSGNYDGEATFGWLKQYGDFGLGTFTHLDGEMIAFDGKFWQIKSDGKAYEVTDKQTTPLSAVTFFKPDFTKELEPGLTYATLPEKLEAELPSKNLFYAIRIDGKFKTIRTRSVGEQQKPYRVLSEVTKTQAIFDMQDVEGTMIGFWCPAYVGAMNVPGFHFHFLTKDKKAGGHVLDFTADKVTLQRENLTSLRVILPQDKEFLKGNFSNIGKVDINKVEK